MLPGKVHVTRQHHAGDGQNDWVRRERETRFEELVGTMDGVYSAVTVRDHSTAWEAIMHDCRDQ
jgi:hypothetical protein